MSRNIIRRALACFLAVIMIAGTTMTTFASEKVETVTPKQTTEMTARGYGSAEFPSQKSVLISGSVTKVAYTAVCTGKTGVVILRFRNRTTGEKRDHTFICNNVYHNSSSLGINPFSEGWWDIDYVMSTCDNFVTIFMNFS